MLPLNALGRMPQGGGREAAGRAKEGEGTREGIRAGAKHTVNGALAFIVMARPPSLSSWVLVVRLDYHEGWGVAKHLQEPYD